MHTDTTWCADVPPGIHFSSTLRSQFRPPKSASALKAMKRTLPGKCRCTNDIKRHSDSNLQKVKLTCHMHHWQIMKKHMKTIENYLHENLPTWFKPIKIQPCHAMLVIEYPFVERHAPWIHHVFSPCRLGAITWMCDPWRIVIRFDLAYWNHLKSSTSPVDWWCRWWGRIV